MVVDKHLEIAREELRKELVVETREDILARHVVYKQLESDVDNAKALHAELCDRLALPTAPKELLSKAEADVSVSQIQVDRLHQVRDVN